MKRRSVFPECWAVLLSNGRGLGRSLSYVGRSQISLFVMLHAALVHKLPYELFLEPLHATVMQKLPLNAFAWNCRAKVAFRSYFLSFVWNCRAKVVLRGYLSR